MSKSRKSLKKFRTIAFHNQGGRCFYCESPMWLENPSAFAEQYCISMNRAHQLRCTGEHLVAHSAGGVANTKNIAAVCYFCNRKRHQRKTNKSPEQYRSFVRLRLAKGRWNTRLLI